MKFKSDVPIETIIDQLTNRLPQLMTEVGVPGLSMALIRDAQVVWAEGFGVMDVRTEEPVTPETFFEGCSLSKPPFAYAALKLHEQKVIDLDTPLSRYTATPHVEDDPRLESITMRTILCHTCGLPNWRPKDKPLNIHLTPGERFSYSGEGYMYLQKVIEEVTGQTGEAFMQSTLFQPLGMTQSTYLWSEDHEQPIATGHNREGEPAKKFYPETMWAAASLHSMPAEFAQFMAATMQPTSDGEALLSPEMTDLMFTPQVQVNDSAPWHDDWPKEAITVDENVSWGLGWGLQHHNIASPQPLTSERPEQRQDQNLSEESPGDSFWHWGDNFTFTAFAAGVRQEGIGVVIMTNSPNGYGLFEELSQEAFGGDYPGLRWLQRLMNRKF